MIKELIPVIIGVVSFLIIYGSSCINVKKDCWILSGYDEGDIIQHYAGWLAYRNSAWQFPLGMADNMAVGKGTIISFTDSIPIVAIFFKLFRNVLPVTFQYFGIYTLLCYILQSVAAFKILNLKTKDVTYSTIGVVLFSFAPILMERAFRHTALGSQWLILFSIYLYLKHCEQNHYKTYILYLLLEILAIGIHPYFIPMVAVFALLCVIQDIQMKKYITIVYLLAIQGTVYIFGVILGVLGTGVNVTRDGYGFYSMNLNAIINPTSLGQYTWSSLMKTHPLILGNYDGFNYLGFGILIFIIMVFSIIILTKKWDIVRQMVKNHIALLSISIFLLCFAVSNVVTCNDLTLLTVPFPEWILKICGIFRASSRLFYPVYYMVFLFPLLLLYKALGHDRRKYTYGMILFIVALQLWDIHGCIIEKHNNMNQKMLFSSYVEDPNLKNIAKGKSDILLEDFQADSRILSVYAFKNNMSTYFSIANSGNYDETYSLTNEILASIKTNGNIGNHIIATTNSEIAEFYKQFPNIDVYEIEGSYFIYGQFYKYNEYLQVYNLSDINWNKGISIDGNRLLFKFSDELLVRLKAASFVHSGSTIHNINDLYYDSDWIHIIVDGDASDCGFPAVLYIE